MLDNGRLRAEQGLSLLECVLALALGVGLIYSVSTIYLSLNKAYTLQLGFIDIQQNARIASVYLARAVHTAGLNICSGHIHINKQAMRLSDPYLIRYLARSKKRASDALTIQSSQRIKGRCMSVDRVFFVANTRRVNKQGEAIYALYEKKGRSPRTELVEPVVGMHVKYRQWIKHQRSVALRDRSSVTDWEQVKAVLVELLFSSNRLIVNKQAYWFNGSEHEGAKHHLYQAWRLYIASRE